MSTVIIRIPALSRAVDDVAQELSAQASTVRDALVEASSNQAELANLRTRVSEVHPAQALALQAQGPAIVDVREPPEISQGTVSGAQPGVPLLRSRARLCRLRRLYRVVQPGGRA